VFRNGNKPSLTNLAKEVVKKHNLSTRNKTMRYTSVDIEINVADNNIFNGSYFFSITKPAIWLHKREHNLQTL
jgi:hypothetical protein